MPRGPGAPVAVYPVVAEQELRKAMAGPQDVLAEVLARADEVADRLLLRRRDADAGELAGAQQPGELAGVATVGLHPDPGADRDESGRDDAAVDAERGKGPLQAVPGGSRLVADPHRPRILPAPHEPAHRLRGIRDLILVGELGPGSQERDADALLVDVEADERDRRDTGEHGRCPPYVAISARQRGQSTRLRRRRPLHTH